MTESHRLTVGGREYRFTMVNETGESAYWLGEVSGQRHRLRDARADDEPVTAAVLQDLRIDLDWVLVRLEGEEALRRLGRDRA
jgi:hypothetical protein